MRRSITVLLIVSILSFTQQKVALMTKIKNDESNNNIVEVDSPSSITYMTLVEGSNDIYEICKWICGVNDMKVYYSETTVYPDYGKVFRCQCEEEFTPWYNLHTLTEVTMDLWKGDPIFNYYLNMPGNYENECKCDNLKSLVLNIWSSFTNLSVS